MNVFMKKILIFCCLAGVVFLNACGGGGGGSALSANGTSVNTPATIDVFSQVNLNAPGFLIQAPDGSIYVTDSTTSGALSGALWNLTGDTGAQISKTLFQAANGLVSLGGNIFVSGIAANGSGQSIFNIQNLSAPLTSIGNDNFAGMVEFNSSNLYVADSNSIVSYSIGGNTLLSNPAPTPCPLAHQPTALTTDGSYIYATSIGFSKIMKISPSCSVSVVYIPSYIDSSTSAAVSFVNPIGISVSSGYMYILDKGNGDDGSIIKMNLSNGQGTVIVSNSVGSWPINKVGLCGGFGLTVSNDGSHLYVTNRTCSINTVNANTILRVSL
jgi:hypothetical protein